MTCPGLGWGENAIVAGIELGTNNEECNVNRTLAAVARTAALVAGLTACAGGDDKSTLPSYTGGSTPPTTTTSRPATTPPTATATATGPVALVAHSTYTYGGLKVMVNLPADIPSASRPSMILSSEFFQGVGRTMASNKLDPSLTDLASAEVVKYIQGAVVPGSVEGIGSVIFTISKVQTVAGRTTEATVCVDQSKLVQVRKDGSHFLDTDTNGKRNPTVKMTATINRGMTGPKLTQLRSAAGTC
jgi:hypothetical protein